MNRLTRQEQLVLCIVLGLLLTGWAVQAYRTAHPLAAAKQSEAGPATPKPSEGGLAAPKPSEGGLAAPKPSEGGPVAAVQHANH